MIGGDSLGEGNLYVTTERLAWLKLGKSGNSKGTGFTVSYPSIAIHAICRDQESFPEPCIFCQLDEPVTKKDNGKAVHIIEGSVDDVVVTGLGDMVEGARAGRSDAAIQENNSKKGEEEEEEEEEASRIDALWRGSDELRFIPLFSEGDSATISSTAVVVPGETLSESILDKIFNAMSECAMLHPDGDAENDEDEEDEGGDEGMGMMGAMLSGSGGLMSGSGGFVADDAFLSDEAMSAEQLVALEAWGAKLKAGQIDDADEEEEEEGDGGGK